MAWIHPSTEIRISQLWVMDIGSLASIYYPSLQKLTKTHVVELLVILLVKGLSMLFGRESQSSDSAIEKEQQHIPMIVCNHKNNLQMVDPMPLRPMLFLLTEAVGLEGSVAVSLGK